MKYGIITFHRAINYGAVLQTYALQAVLNKNGMDAEVIDYACEYLEKYYKAFYVSDNTIKGFVSAILYYPIRKQRIKKFQLFKERYISISTKRNVCKQELRDIEKNYDYIITGSDQVWNPEQTGNDTTYFLDFVAPGKKISYAASLGTSEPNQHQIEIYKKYIEGYKQISIREKESALYLEKLLKKEILTVVDPVFLVSKTDWVKIAGNQAKIKKPYIFVYCLHEKSCYHYAEILAKKAKIIVSIPNSLKVKINGKKDFTAGISDFLNYICYADYVITDSFHASAFSIIFEKQFNIVMKQIKKTLNGRLIELAKKYEIENCVIYNIDDVKRLGTKIVYDCISKKKDEDVAEAMKFLENIERD